MSEYIMSVADLIADQEDCLKRGLIPAAWPISGDDLARHVACI